MSVLEFRVALTVQDWEAAVSFYRDGLGLDPGALFEDGGKGQLFEIGTSTLEVFDEAQAAGVDQIEVGQRISGAIRFAFQVPDLDAALTHAQQYGAQLVHAPVETPWGDRNARLQAPDGMQITLYQIADK
jgi:methylmalonyl-CoA/ethylmalonyl-CoA epimerase